MTSFHSDSGLVFFFFVQGNKFETSLLLIQRSTDQSNNKKKGEKKKQDWSNWNSVYVGLVRFYVMKDYVCFLSPFARSQLMELRRLGAEQSFDGGVDVAPGGDEGLQVGFPVDEAHGTQLLQLLLETHFWSLSLQSKK